jgi:hypothetical protein
LKIIEILRREIISAMRLVGATNVKDLKPEMVRRPHIDVVARAHVFCRWSALTGNHSYPLSFKLDAMPSTLISIYTSFEVASYHTEYKEY